MNLLRGARVYLSGPVEHDEGAASWRKLLTEYLLRMGVRVWDPLVKPSWVSDIDQARQAEMSRRLGDGEASSEERRRIRDKFHGVRLLGLSMASNCDVMVVKLPCRCLTVGTLEELAFARYKPVLVFSDVRDPSMWLVDQLDLWDDIDFVFHEGMPSLIHTLRQVDSGELVPPDKTRWLFLYH